MKFVDFMADSRDFYNDLIDPVCKKYGLTQMEFHILLFLANNPECDTAAQIIKKRAFTKSHVSVSVRSLEERGLLVGEYQGINRRTIHLKLTDSAAPIISDGKNVQKKAAEIICRGFSPDEHRKLFEFMNRINTNISDYRKEGNLHEQQQRISRN